jgi:indolepyruvate ferredoxin oxidoreductase, alpha subunit
MARTGFDLSEKLGTPVLLRITTRLAHSRSGVVPVASAREENKFSFPKDRMQFMLLPAYGRRHYQALLDNQPNLKMESEKSCFNSYTEGKDKTLGIVCCGIAINYLNENFPEGYPYPVVKVSQYPLPAGILKKLEQQSDEILVIEEGYPLVEELLKGFFEKGKKISGKLDGTLPRSGELNPDLVAKALNIKTVSGAPVPRIIANRPPSLCKGCGHHDTFKALNDALAGYGDRHVFSDIGCYTLGALPPYNSVISCVDMGASVTMAKGAADAGLFPSVAVIGDSTFTHSGITGLLDAVNEKSNVVVIICDNESTAMTGGQDSSAFGKIESICEGVGVEPSHIRVIEALPKNHSRFVKIIEEEIAYDGVSVIIPRRECIQKNARRVKKKVIR